MDDMWLWDGSVWAEQHPFHRPSARSDFGIAYDENQQKIVLFGGISRGKLVNDTWVWDGQDWEQLLPTHSPSQEIAYAPRMVYSPTLKGIILYNAFRQKRVTPDGKADFSEHSEFWALTY